MTYDILINGTRRDVEITSPIAEGSRMAAIIDGRSVMADTARISPGAYSMLLDGRSFDVTVQEATDGLLVRINGREFKLEIADPRAWRRGRSGSIELAGRQQIAAPLPGKIVRVLAAMGQQVEPGQGLLVIEAMKMQNEIRSPKSGTVEKIVREGQTVNAGEILAVVA
jgi:biotin carboxyl carrier protein